MPIKGFVSVTVSEETYQELKDFAEKTKRSVPKVIEYLMECAKDCKEKEASKVEA